MRKLLAGTGMGLALALTSLTPALAASSTGAQAYHQHECFDWGWATGCVDAHGEFNTTQTPSGNTNFQSNGKVNLTISYPGMGTYQEENSYHYKSLWKANEPQVYSSHYHDSFTAPWGNCTVDANYHHANGSEQFNNFQVVCS
jgi:hypothetical protein